MFWGKIYLFRELFVSLNKQYIMPEMGAERMQDFVKSVCNFCSIVAGSVTLGFLFMTLPDVKFCDKN